MPDADYRDCIELAGQIAESVSCYDSDDLPEVIIPHLKPFIGRIQELEKATEHWLLYTNDREHGGMKIEGVFGSSDDAWKHYSDTHDTTARYWRIPFVERWENGVLIER